jgi:hypothetical protein
MKKETLIVMVKLVVDTSLQTTEQTALEIREKLKMKMVESKSVTVLEAHMIGCMTPDESGDDEAVMFVN